MRKVSTEKRERKLEGRWVKESVKGLSFSSPTFFNYNILVLTFLPLNQTFTVQETF